jgi:O-antigen ligase
MHSDTGTLALASRPAPVSTGFIGFVGRGLFLVIVPLSIVWIPIGDIPGAGTITLGDSALVALWGVTAVALLVRGVADLDLRTPLMIVLAMAIGVLAGIASEMSTVSGRGGTFEFMQFVKRFGLASILPLAAGLFRSRGNATWTRTLAAAAIGAFVAFTLFPELQQHLPRRDEWHLDAFEREGRGIGLVTNPNDLAYAAVALAALYAALLPRRPRTFDKVVLMAVLAGAAFCIISSGSRSGVLGAAGALMFLIVSSGIRGSTKMALIASIAAAASLGLSQSTVFEERLAQAYREGLREANVGSRLDAQAFALRYSLSHPFGIGFTNFDLATSESASRRSLRTTDSVYLDTLLGAGYPGLFCLLWLFWTAWRHVRRVENGEMRAAVLKAALIAFLLFGAATVVPVAVFLSPLFFSLVGVASYERDDAS